MSSHRRHQQHPGLVGSAGFAKVQQVTEGQVQRHLLGHGLRLALHRDFVDAEGGAFVDHMGAGKHFRSGAEAAEHVIGGRPQQGVAERRLEQVRARAHGREEVLLGLIGVV